MIRRRSRVEVDSASRRVLPPRRALGTGFFPLVLSLCPGEISTLRARVAGPAFAVGIEAALTTARETNEPIVVVFVATWCPLCTEPGRKALLDDPAILACGDDSVWVRIDIDRKLTTEGLVDDFGPFSDNSNEITIGYKWELRSRGILEIGLIENIVSFDDSPDFGIHARFSQLF